MPRLLAALCLVTACHGEEPSRFPARQPGCEVKVSSAAPDVPTESIGTVTASCDDDVAAADCMRTLQDQACKLGADVVWGVDPPKMKNGKQMLSGRAAHTK